jgi:hypothetical protein
VLLLVLVLVLEIPSVKTARTDSIAPYDSFSHGAIQALRTFHSRAAGVIGKPSPLEAPAFSVYFGSIEQNRYAGSMQISSTRTSRSTSTKE